MRGEKGGQESSLLRPFHNTEILVVGDIMLDRYQWGKVRRISPEAPVPVVQLERTTQTLGGAGNVALNLASLGCNVTVVGTCGDDPCAQSIKSLLARNRIADRLVMDDARPTTTKTRIMAQKQQVLRLDEEITVPLAMVVSECVRKEALAALKGCHAVVLSDYGKGLFSGADLIQEIIVSARRQGIPVLVDPKGTDWERYRGASGITPNTAELEAVAGMPLEGNEEALTPAAREIQARFGVDWLLVTRGPEGMCLVTTHDPVVRIPAQAREVFDVSGAGDTVVATLAATLASGMPLDEAARTANLAAGIVVGKLGTQPILASELATALQYHTQHQYYPYAAAKMTSLEAARVKVQEWKDAGSRIVFTNGCFDLLHPGHISLLYQARALGDRLVVGLNTDASIRRLKGAGRPILSEQDRAAMLGALACVDLVVHFDADTPLGLLQILKPDVLVKGADYTPDQVVGKETVEAYGGRVALVDLVKGYSTTLLTQKVVIGCRNTEAK